jgi:transcriptional regulator with XRE-family HTH domain/enoyl-CoA hydratase/carnithine racemase
MAIRRDGLARRRRAAGFTQEQLAEHLGVDRITVNRWESGQLTPQSWNQPKLATALEISREELIHLLHPDAVQSSAADLSGRGSGSSAERADPGTVAKIQATAQAFQAADRRVGGGVLYPSVIRYLSQEIGPRLLDPGDGPHGSALFAAAASVTEIAGWMSHDSGHDTRASQHFDRAFRLARAADDQTLAGNCCASMAHLAVELDQADDALRIAMVGLGCTPDSGGTKRLIARLHAMRARAFALQVDRTSCVNALKLADRVMEQAKAEEIADWIAAFDEASLASEASLCFVQLAEYSEAELRAREVIRLRSGDRVRSRAFGQLTLANILLQAGRVDEAAALGREVCLLTQSLSSTRVADRLNDLARGVKAVSSGPEVVDFLATLQALDGTSPDEEGHTAAWPV